MRQITNRAGLPEPMFNALAKNNYIGGGDTSATRLIAPPRIVTLRFYHEDEIVEDAADRVWSLLGSATHYVLENSIGDSTATVEKRLFMPFQGPEGIWQVSAQPDVYHNEALYDYKVTSVWSFIFAEKPEWTKQLNIQAMLHRFNGDVVKELYIVAILRDWSMRKALVERDYPKAAVVKISVPVWTQEECEAYVQGRVDMHQRLRVQYGKDRDADKLPLCTPDERWYRGAKWAVKYKEIKTGKVNKNAKRTFDDLTGAKEFMENNQKNLPKGKMFADVEHRPGENIRCEMYCDVAKFCPFGQKILAEKQAKQEALVNENQQELPGTEEEEAA